MLPPAARAAGFSTTGGVCDHDCGPADPDLKDLRENEGQAIWYPVTVFTPHKPFRIFASFPGFPYL